MSMSFTVKSLVSPKRPDNDSWIYQGRTSPNVTLGYEGHAWRHREQGLFVISAVEVAEQERGPDYHVSISRRGGRCSRAQAKMVLRHFDMLDAEEDNHVPYGYVRNFFLPVNANLVGKECPCKADEPAIVEDKGEFTWRPVD